MEDENGNSRKVWTSAPLLTDVMNVFSFHDSIPSSGSSVLVTPNLQKDRATVPVNFQLMAMGESLKRLYTIILNDCLLKRAACNQPVEATRLGPLDSGLESPPSTTSLPSSIPLTMH